MPSYKLKSGKSVKLGRTVPLVKRQGVKIGDYLKPGANPQPHPAQVVRSTKAAKSLKEMLGNDQEGDCVVASMLHGLGVWSANDTDSAGEVIGNTADALRIYHEIGGRGDNGLVITDALDYFRDVGLRVGATNYKIDGWAEVDPTNRHQLESTLMLFGGLEFGISVYDSMFDTPEGGTWDKVSGPYRGGHDVKGVDYVPKGVVVSTWGGLRLCTWEFLAANRTTDEAYTLLSPNWYGSDRMSPDRVDVAGLQAALELVRAGGDPSIDPTPIPPAPDPDPIDATIVYAVDLVASAAAANSPALYRLKGNVVPVVITPPGPTNVDGMIRGPNGKLLTWQEWVALIIQIIMQILPLFAAGMSEAQVYAKLRELRPDLFAR